MATWHVVEECHSLQEYQLHELVDPQFQYGDELCELDHLVELVVILILALVILR